MSTTVQDYFPQSLLSDRGKLRLRAAYARYRRGSISHRDYLAVVETTTGAEWWARMHLTQRMRSLVYNCLHNPSSKSKRLEDTAGYTAEALRCHIEGLFDRGMSWANHGASGWHIDHIIPLHAFNYARVEHLDFRRAWALPNLQPLWIHDNHSKAGRIPIDFQPCLALRVGVGT